MITWVKFHSVRRADATAIFDIPKPPFSAANESNLWFNLQKHLRPNLKKYSIKKQANVNPKDLNKPISELNFSKWENITPSYWKFPENVSLFCYPSFYFLIFG